MSRLTLVGVLRCVNGIKAVVLRRVLSTAVLIRVPRSSVQIRLPQRGNVPGRKCSDVAPEVVADTSSQVDILISDSDSV